MRSTPGSSVLPISHKSPQSWTYGEKNVNRLLTVIEKIVSLSKRRAASLVHDLFGGLARES